ncbi:unnamed protein product [Leuciscus chuanchicus]
MQITCLTNRPINFDGRSRGIGWLGGRGRSLSVLFVSIGSESLLLSFKTLDEPFSARVVRLKIEMDVSAERREGSSCRARGEKLRLVFVFVRPVTMRFQQLGFATPGLEETHHMCSVSWFTLETIKETFENQLQ